MRTNSFTEKIVPAVKVVWRSSLLMNKNPENKNNWQEFQDGLAESKGLAIVLLEEDGLSYIHASNNNSICRNLTASKEFAQQCERFCGKVYSKTV